MNIKTKFKTKPVRIGSAIDKLIVAEIKRICKLTQRRQLQLLFGATDKRKSCRFETTPDSKCIYVATRYERLEL